MEFQTTIVLLLLALGTTQAALPLPAYMTPCRREDISGCATPQATKVLQAIAKGDRMYSIPSIDPFEVELMQVTQPGISMNFTKMQLLGMSNATIKNITMDEASKTFRIDYFMPKVSCVADCSMDANLRVIRLRGKGSSRIDMFNITGNWSSTYTEEKHSDGLHYLKFLASVTKIQPTKATFQFENLINNDKTLGDAVNGLLNENWRDVIDDVRPSVEVALAEMLSSAVRGMTRIVPIGNMFSQT